MDVFTEERQAEILRIMDAEGRVSVEELAKKFSVSEVTIRRDLKAISKAYPNIKRTYGGAIKRTRIMHGAFWHGGFESVNAATDTEMQDRTNDNIISEVKTSNILDLVSEQGKNLSPGTEYGKLSGGNLSDSDMLIMEKNIRIAEFAVNFIQENDMIAMESAYINTILAQKIPPGLKLKVFTNCPLITSIMSGSNRNAEIYCSGGLLNKECNAFLDLKALEFFNDFFTDRAFISLDAMDSNFMITTDIKEKADIKKNIIKHTKEKIALCNSSCLNTTLAYNIGDIKYIDILVIDREADKDFLEELKKTNLRVYVV